MSIPRRFIQTGKHSNLAPMAKAAVTNITLLHPEWEYLFFDDVAVERFIATKFPQYQPVFHGFRYPIQKFDFFRYLAVFELGGFYFDLDVYLSEKIDPLLEHECVFPFEELTLNRFLREKCGMDWEIGNYAFGASPGNAFLEAVIENCIRAQRDPMWLRPMMDGVPRLLQSQFYIFNTTGPGLLSRTLAEHPDLLSSVKVLFPPDVCDSAAWHQFGDYGVHSMEGSWRGEEGWLWHRVTRYWEVWSRARSFRQSVARGPTRGASLGNDLLEAPAPQHST